MRRALAGLLILLGALIVLAGVSMGIQVRSPAWQKAIFILIFVAAGGGIAWGGLRWFRKD